MESDADSVGDLARRTMTDQSSVSVVVARLEERGLVSRRPSKTDARRTIVSITEAGVKTLDGAPETLQGRLVSALQQMPEESLTVLTKALAHLIALMGATDEPLTFLFEDDATGAP